MKILVSVIVLLLCCFSLDGFGSDASQADSASNQSNNPENPNPPPISSPVELLEGLVQYFKAAEVKNREQEKVNQELKEQIKLLKEQNVQYLDAAEVKNQEQGKMNQELKEEIKLLKEQNVQYFNAAEVKNQEQGKMNQELKEEIKLLKEENAQELKTLSDKFEELQNKISEDHGLWLMTPPLRGPPGKDGKQGEQGLSPLSISSCTAVMELLPSPRSQKQTLYPHGNGKSLDVLCDFETDGGGWTIIQKRTSGPQQDFDRSWTEYQNGFGSVSGDFWLGLDNIHALTKNEDQELRIELEDFEGNKKYAKYSSFSISDASDFYRLTISGFFASSTAGDSMTHNVHAANGARFSTKDKDTRGYNCVEKHSTGGWWINACFYASLNGLYRGNGETVPHGKGIMWYSWTEHSKSLAKTEIKIRTRK